MKKIIDFLMQSKVFFLATAEGSQPRCRPFGLVIEFEGKLYFGTGGSKDVYKQLEKNPKFEICAVSQDASKWLRISAVAGLEDNLEAKKKAFEIAPFLAQRYKSYDNSEFKVFYAKDMSATLYSMTGAPESIEIK
ncbi:MAG: pyridoxamine 5'-phosphate oxidase family protein [Elusimicrobiota bacterium]|jgi:uncharacterized pyridoxamine 5'-phosphate oxidase family protein|nr:pyridoxamine 5'-phosphate oxidase family protein [Elusimicrobiota bacterium]